MAKKKKLKLKLKLPLNLILSLIAIFFIVYLIFFFEFKEIKIQEKETDYLKSNFKNKSLSESIFLAKELINKYPEIKQIKIRKDFFNQRLIFDVKSSHPIFRICDPKKCFYLDNYGEIIESKIYLNKKIPLIYSYLEIKKETIIHPKIKTFLDIFLQYANWKPFIFKQIKIYHNFDISVIDVKDREFIFDPNKDIIEQVKKMEIFLQKNFQAQRIDLRIKKKIFFK